jgi:hypothetical protein
MWSLIAYSALLHAEAHICKEGHDRSLADIITTCTARHRLELWPHDLTMCWCSLELWCFELIVILAGLLPNPEDQVSAMTVCFNTAALCFMLPLGLSTAVR